MQSEVKGKENSTISLLANTLCYSKYVLITKKKTCINFLTSLICTNVGIWTLELFVEGSAPNAIYNSAICSSLQILAYLMILILFHCDKCCFPLIERTCISPYFIYKIVDYKDLRVDNEEKQEPPLILK